MRKSNLPMAGLWMQARSEADRRHQRRWGIAIGITLALALSAQDWRATVLVGGLALLVAMLGDTLDRPGPFDDGR